MPKKEVSTLEESYRHIVVGTAVELGTKAQLVDLLLRDVSGTMILLHEVRESQPEYFASLNSLLQAIRPSTVVYLQREFAKYHNPNKEANCGSEEETAEGSEAAGSREAS